MEKAKKTANSHQFSQEEVVPLHVAPIRNPTTAVYPRGSRGRNPDGTEMKAHSRHSWGPKMHLRGETGGLESRWGSLLA